MDSSSRYRSGWEEPPERFDDQFAPDGDHYLYRYGRIGPLFRVSEADKAALLPAFVRTERGIRYVGLAIFVVWLAILFFAPYFRTLPRGDWDASILTTNLAAAFVVQPLIQRLAMARLRDNIRASHTPIAPALTGEELRRVQLDKVSPNTVYGCFWIGATILAFVFIFGGPINAGGWVITLGASAMLLWGAIQGTRKWLQARHDHVASTLI